MANASKPVKSWHALALGSVLLLALLIRIPLINHGLPYIYDEDEAHHFNRQVNMLKTGELNPKYFLKPSLNFYLRLPALSSGFLWSVRNEQARSIQDVKTKDPFGIAGYSFSTSHPAVMKANRIYSILLCLTIIGCVYLLTYLLTQKISIAAIAGLLTSVAPLSIEHSISIGVNQPAALFIIISILFAVLYVQKSSTRNSIYLIVTSAIAAGLAISTKYNALPIVAIPLVISCLRKPFNLWHVFLSAKLPWLAFIAASPFILAEIPLFLDHLAYEVWHYGVAGHAGNMAEPGIAQLLHYIKVIIWNGEGAAALFFICTCFLVLLTNPKKVHLPVTLFFVLYLLLMVSQKANFARNLLLVSPIIAVLTACGLNYAQEFFRSKLLFAIFLACLFLQPVFHSYLLIQEKLGTKETRQDAFDYLHRAENINTSLAVDGHLEMQQFVKFVHGKKQLSRPGTSRVDLHKEQIPDLYLAGFDQALISNHYDFSGPDRHFYSVKKFFSGISVKQRFPVNPSMYLLDFKTAAPEDHDFREYMLELNDSSISSKTFELNNNDCVVTSSATESWQTQRIIHLDIDECRRSSKTNLKLNLYNPWPKQEIALLQKSKLLMKSTYQQAGNFSLIYPLGNFNTSEKVYLWVKTVQSPQALGHSDDARRLGLQFLNQ